MSRLVSYLLILTKHMTRIREIKEYLFWLIASRYMNLSWYREYDSTECLALAPRIYGIVCSYFNKRAQEVVRGGYNL